jgi:hypothetical protein
VTTVEEIVNKERTQRIDVERRDKAATPVAAADFASHQQ